MISETLKRASIVPAPLTPLGIVLASALMVLAASPSAMADSGRLMPRDVPAAYVQECGSCHTAYPPGMLPARSWQRVMDGLERHYGTDASVDADTLQKLNGWLQTHAGSYKRTREEPAQDRITRSAWFARKHRRMDPQVWTHPSVKSAANCTACHTRANDGDYDDDNVRFPAGLHSRYRSAWTD
jgi:cytochrome c553